MGENLITEFGQEKDDSFIQTSFDNVLKSDRKNTHYQRPNYPQVVTPSPDPSLVQPVIQRRNKIGNTQLIPEKQDTSDVIEMIRRENGLIPESPDMSDEEQSFEDEQNVQIAAQTLP